MPWYGPATAQLETLGLAGWRLARALAWRRLRRRGLTAIAQAADLTALVATVRAFSLQAAPRVPTLGRWLERKTFRCEGLEELIAAMEQAAYSPHEADQTSLKTRALLILAKARPVS